MSFYMRYDDDMVVPYNRMMLGYCICVFSVLFHTLVRTLKEGFGLNLSHFLHCHFLECRMPSGLFSHLQIHCWKPLGGV